MNTLTATDLRGLDPEDVRFIVGAQMQGNEQQRLMFGQAMNHLNGQQQRMDQARSAVENARTSQELEYAKHNYRQIENQTKGEIKQLQEQTKFQQDLLTNMAKTGNTTAAAKSRTLLSTQYAMLQNQLMQTEDPEKRKQIHALSQEIIHDMISIQDAADPEKANAYNSMTQDQLQRMEERREKEYFDTKMMIADPETPPVQKQMLMEKLNRPDSPVYHLYTPPQEETGKWIPFYGEDAVEEHFQEIMLPPHHQTGKQATVQDVYELAYGLNITVPQAIEVMRQQGLKNAQKVTKTIPPKPTQ